MPCCETCACADTDVECLAVVDPSRFGLFREWCAGADSLLRAHVLNRSRIAAETGHVAGPVPAPVVPATPSLPLAGDIVEALAYRIGADRLARFVERKLGVPCNCTQRQAALNRLDASLRRYLAR